MPVVGDAKLFWNADRVESGGVKETHRDDNPSYSCFARCCDIARHWSAERDRCPPERGRNLSPLVRGVFRPGRTQLRLRLVRTMHDDGDPRHRRLVRAKSLVPLVRTEQLERRGPRRPAQETGVARSTLAPNATFSSPRTGLANPQRTGRDAPSLWAWTTVKGRKGRRGCPGDSP
jgi:hypothetical protein